MTNDELDDARCEALIKLAVAVQVYQAAKKAGDDDRIHETAEWLHSLKRDYVALHEDRDETIVQTQPEAARYTSTFKTFLKKCYMRSAHSLYQRLPSLYVLPKTISAHLLMCSLRLKGKTYVSLRRLANLYRVCSDPSLPRGSLVECGVAKGGCIAIMSFASLGKRTVWGFDSFEGMPDLTEEDEGQGQGWVGVQLAGPNGIQEAITTLERFHVSGSWVRLVPGWNEDTLHEYILPIGPIAVLRLDNDWYDATKYCLNVLYDSVVIGGTIIIDDYHLFTGCRKAVDEFRSQRRIASPLITTEKGSEVTWSKSE